MTEIDYPRVLRELLKNYTVFESLCSQSGNYFIEHKGLSISFHDLQGCLRKLSKRKKEAIFFNVILDKKQREVAEIMGITTVSVGQYVDQGMIQVTEWLWPDVCGKKQEKAK